VSQFNGDLGLGVSGNSVASRLRLHPEKDKGFTPLAGQLLRKYISYSREHVFPRYCAFRYVKKIIVLLAQVQFKE
jgi:DNA helicase MCM8